MTLTVEALDQQKRREASRRLAVSTILLCLVSALGVATANVNHPEPAPAALPERVGQLEDANQRQAEELAKLRNLFTYCRSRLGWADNRCGTPTGTASDAIVVTQPTQPDDDDDDGDSDDGGDTSVTIVQPRPSASPTRGSESPDTGTDTGNGSGGANGTGGGGNGKSGDRPAERGGK